MEDDGRMEKLEKFGNHEISRDCSSSLWGGGGPSSPVYDFNLCPFTLKELLVLGFKIKTDPLSNTSRISYGPSHLERNFPRNSLR